MTEVADVVGSHALAEQHLDARKDGARGIVRGRWHFADRHRTGVFIEIDEVGERAACIDCDAVTRHWTPLLHCLTAETRDPPRHSGAPPSGEPGMTETKSARCCGRLADSAW